MVATQKATAVHGTAHTVKSISDLRAGMKVHREIKGRRGVLVNAGEVLTKRHIDKLIKWENQPKPRGPCLPKRDLKDPNEGIRHGEFVGGYRPSDFNPTGYLVTTTLASGDEAPAVEKDPSLSPMIRKGSPRKSYAAGDVGVESPLLRERALMKEISALSKANVKLGGTLHAEAEPDGEEALMKRRDSLKTQNEELAKKENAPPADLAPKRPGPFRR